MFISTSEELARFCERASSSRVLAVDTEFLRERTYHPRLCLLQLAISPDDIAAVDPIAIRDLSPVARLFQDPAITKVIHACSQDLEVLDVALGCVPTPLFDTQVAAAFLGHRMQLGYGPLVEAYTGVHLAKAESLTDWSRRPLDPEQLDYAEDDVRYLPGIYERMVSQLVELDRMSWVLPEMQSLTAPEHYRHIPERAYLHLKRVSEPTDVQRLRRIRGTEQLSVRDADALLHAVTQGLACPASKLPGVARRSRPTPEQESVVDLMYAMLRIVAEKSGVAAQLIASRDDLLDLLCKRPHATLAEGWRHELAGRRLEGLLSGGCGLTVKDGRVEIL